MVCFFISFSLFYASISLSFLLLSFLFLNAALSSFLLLHVSGQEVIPYSGPSGPSSSLTEASGGAFFRNGDGGHVGESYDPRARLLSLLWSPKGRNVRREAFASRPRWKPSHSFDRRAIHLSYLLHKMAEDLRRSDYIGS